MRETRIDEPFTVGGFASRETPAWRPKLLFGGSCGDMVAVRPVGDEHGGRTFLGVLIGEIAQGVSMGHRKADDFLVYDMAGHNPAIFVPDLSTVVFGNASWWGRIRSADDLRQISDADIENVWYVRALRQIEEAAARKGAETSEAAPEE